MGLAFAVGMERAVRGEGVCRSNAKEYMFMSTVKIT